MPTPEDPTPSINPIDALIADYLREVENGKVPDRRSWLDRNPDHAEALQSFFSDFDRMDRVAAPLRMSGDLDETAAVDTTGLAQLTTVRYFGDYELLEEIARGGMGVVYKARQTSLNRLVALKMILAGTFATPREVARFQAEAEAAANLDHPGIVPVYEVGEHDGQQYFSMKFIEGGSLASVPRKDIKTEVKGMIAMSRAVHYAHQHGVLHRDLKPSNVLVDPRGDRHVTDFGLAKRLAEVDRSLTEAGQILGTPRYMSPEQAAGRKDLTVAADVYALGVILYERLTGRTPFESHSALELLRQVRETEPPRPSGFCPTLDRDLETIVLKSLEKDPGKRYPTAQDLVEDLTRWYEGRPIAARPVGQLERSIRWCRRNPVVAGLTASVMMALLMGVVVSSVFAYQERKARIRAEMAEDTTERALARSLVRPLNVDGLGEFQGTTSFDPEHLPIKKPPLSEPESEALWLLANEGSENLRTRFLREAIRDPLTLRQILARSEPAKVAALGVDSSRLARAKDVLFERLRDPSMQDAERIDLAIFTLLFEERPDSRFDEAAKVIIRALGDKLSDKARQDLEEKILLNATQMDATRALALLLKESERASSEFFWQKFTSVEPKLSVQLNEEQLRDVSRRLADMIVSKPDGIEASVLSSAFPWFARRLGTIDVETLASQLILALGADKGDHDRSSLIRALSSLSSNLGTAQAAAACGQLVTRLEREKDAPDRAMCAKSLTELLDCIDSTEVLPVARRLLSLVEREKQREVKDQLMTSLSSVLSRLDLSGTAGQEISGLVEAETEPGVKSERLDAKIVFRNSVASLEIAVESLAKAGQADILKTILPRLTATAQTSVARRAARALIDKAKDETDQNTLGSLFDVFAWMCLYLDRTEIGQFVDPMISILKRDEQQMTNTAAGHLSPLVERMDLADVLRCVNELFVEAEKGGLPEHSTLSESCTAFCMRLDSSQAAAFTERLFARWEREPDADARRRLAWDLPAFSKRLDSSQAAAFTERLSSMLDREPDAWRRPGLADVLSTLSLRLDSSRLSALSERLFTQLGRVPDFQSRQALASALLAVSSRLDGPAASQFARSAIMHIERESNPGVRADLVQALSAVSVHLDKNQVEMIVRRLAAQKDFATLRAGEFVESFLVILSRMEANEAIPLARQVARNLFETSHVMETGSEGMNEYIRSTVLQAIALLLAHYESPELALEITTLLCSSAVDDSNADDLRGLIAPMMPRLAASNLLQRSIAEIQFGTCGAIGCMIRESAEVIPCCLKTQQIVDLLKMPTVVGDTRRMLLDQLEGIHGRRFANHWEFVRFAQEAGLKLDFTSPPRRPDPKSSVGRLLDELSSGR